jgi:hypothetical protein
VALYTGLSTIDVIGTKTNVALTAGVNTASCSVTTTQTDTIVGFAWIGLGGYPYSFAAVTWSNVTSGFTVRSPNPVTLGYLLTDDIGAASGTQTFSAQQTGTAGGSTSNVCIALALH